MDWGELAPNRRSVWRSALGGSRSYWLAGWLAAALPGCSPVGDESAGPETHIGRDAAQALRLLVKPSNADPLGAEADIIDLNANYVSIDRF